MKKRVGNDVKMTWTILRSGQAEIFDNATNIKIYAYQINSSTSNIEVDYVRNSNVFSINIPADNLNVGTYDLRLTYNKTDADIEGGVGSYAIDEHEAFQIVKHTEAEDAAGTDITGEVIYYHDSYVYIASASSALGADFTYPANISQDYLAILNSTTEIPEPSVTDFEGLWFPKIAAYRAAVIGGYTGTEEQFYIDLALVSTKENALPETPENPDIKFLNGLRQWATIAIGAGGFSSPLYFTNIDSDIAGYKKISNTAESSITELVSTVTSADGEKFLRAYAYDFPLGTTVIDAGPWISYYKVKVSNATGVTQLVLKVYRRATNGTETLLFSADSSEINNTSYEVLPNQIPKGIYTILATDRLVCKIYAKTTSGATITITTSIGDGDASYITTPLALRHIQLREPNQDPNYQHVTTGAQTFEGAKTFTSPVKVATPTTTGEAESTSNKKSTITDSETDYPNGKAVYNANNLFNVTLAVPLTAGQYYTSTTARAAVPTGVRKRGLELVYETSAGVWFCERFIGASVTTWTTATDWEIVPNKKYVDDADALKVNNTTLENTEEVTAEALVQLKNRIDALQKIIQDMILGSVQIDSLNIVKTFNLYGSSNMILTGSAAPAVVPDFIGQFFIKTSATTACYQATGNSSVGDWKQIG